MAATRKSDGAPLKDDAEIELRLEVYDALAKNKGADTVVAQAELHGISRQHMFDIRAGKSQLGLKLGLRMAADLGTTVEALFKRRAA